MQINLIQAGKIFKGKTILEDVTLEVNEGDIILISGESGSGKTTLLNIIGGLEKPTSGKLIAGGKEITTAYQRTMLRRNMMGFVFQDYGLVDDETVKDNLNVISYIRKISEKDMKQSLEKVGLDSSILDHKVYELSGGEQQRVSVARALLKKAPILLADEPTGNLDRRNAELIFNLFSDLNKKGITVLCVSHDPEVGKYFSRRVIIEDKTIREE